MPTAGPVDRFSHVCEDPLDLFVEFVAVSKDQDSCIGFVFKNPLRQQHHHDALATALCVPDYSALIGSLEMALASWTRPARLSCFRLPLVPKPIPAPRCLHPILPTGRVHLRQPFQRPRPLTPAHECGEFLHVGEGLANGVKSTVKFRTFDFRFCRPLEAALVVVALEFELSDEHQHSMSNSARWPRKSTATTPPTSSPIQPFAGRFLSAFTIFLTFAHRRRAHRRPTHPRSEEHTS